MAETAWTEEANVPPPKKKIPTWVWFCGGGCLALVILGALLAGVAFRFAKSSMDPEQQWPKVEAILPFDERPPELELKVGNTLGVGMFFFEDSRGYIAVLMQAPPSDQQMRKQMLDESFTGSVFGVGGRKDMKAGKVTVQGRELDLLRYHQTAPGDSDEDAVAVNVDLTPESSNRGLFLQLVRKGGRNNDPISDDEIRTFLKPFHVGTDR
jgi:hypothetical protein